MEPLAYFNGQLLPAREVRLSVADAGVVQGAAVTDMARTYGGRLFRFADHVERFRSGCQRVGIPLIASDAELHAMAEALVAANRPMLPAGGELCVVTFATPGELPQYLWAASDAGPTLVMHTMPLRLERFASLLKDGADLFTPPTRHQTNLPRDLKQRSRLFWRVAEAEAAAVRPGAMALLLDTADCVTETAAANFVIVRDGGVVAPPADAVLDGTALRVLIDLCRAKGIAFTRRPLPLAECERADEALLTSTPFGLAGVRRINDAVLAYPGATLLRLESAWHEETAK